MGVVNENYARMGGKANKMTPAQQPVSDLLGVGDITDHISMLEWCGYMESDTEMVRMIERFVHTFAEPEMIE